MKKIILVSMLLAFLLACGRKHAIETTISIDSSVLDSVNVSPHHLGSGGHSDLAGSVQ